MCSFVYIGFFLFVCLSVCGPLEQTREGKITLAIGKDWCDKC